MPGPTARLHFQQETAMNRNIWLNDKIRYLVVGAYNTVVGYGIFAALWILWGHSLHYAVILTLCHAFAVTNAFFSYRTWVFHERSGSWAAFARFNMIYLGAFLFNILAFPVLTGDAALHPLVAQALISIVTVAASYVLHRGFSFRHG
jgi:putative flippase GtrA